jgi:hypothetical protein
MIIVYVCLQNETSGVDFFNIITQDSLQFKDCRITRICDWISKPNFVDCN